MKRNPNPPRMFCSFFFFLSHFHTLPLTNTHTHREREERREKRDVCAIALIANKGAAIQEGGWGGGKGKEYIHTHTRMAMDGCAALRCNGYTAMDALRCNGKEMGRDFAVVVIRFLFLLSSCCYCLSARA